MAHAHSQQTCNPSREILLKDVEQRLTDHLLRIETKLDSGFMPFESGRR